MPVIAFAISVVIMPLVIPPALRRRAHAARAKAAERDRLQEDAIDVGSGLKSRISSTTNLLEPLIAGLSTSGTTWSDSRITGGPDGIVASRDAIDGIENSWAYDLWLVERIAERLALVPLADARIGPAWNVPYGLGRNSRAQTKLLASS